VQNQNYSEFFLYFKSVIVRVLLKLFILNPIYNNSIYIKGRYCKKSFETKLSSGVRAIDSIIKTNIFEGVFLIKSESTIFTKYFTITNKLQYLLYFYTKRNRSLIIIS